MEEHAARRLSVVQQVHCQKAHTHTERERERETERKREIDTHMYGNNMGKKIIRFRTNGDMT